jgi:PRTRC genetic system ThiF family protein
MKFTIPSQMMNRHIHVTVVGCGGTGSYLLPLLAQMNYLLRNLSNDECGINVTAYDPAVVSPTNCGRQNFWPMDINKPKSQVLIERLNMGFGTHWTYNVRKATGSFYSCDVLMTCVDTISSRLSIGNEYADITTEKIWIDGGNDDRSGNIIFGHLGQPSEGQKLPNWFDLYADTMKHIADDDTKSCSHEQSISRQDFGVNQQCALIMARALWRLLRHGSTDKGMHYFDVRDESIDSMNIDPQVWSMFNYVDAPKQGQGAH